MVKYRELNKSNFTDEEIIEMYWQREEKAIQVTDKKYGKALFRVGYNILNDTRDSEECQNDTYLHIWNAIPPTKPNKFFAFIMQIMRRVSINRYKKKMSQKRIVSEFTISMDDLIDTLQSNESVESEYEAQEIGKIISAYLRGLSEKQQYVFVGKFYMAESVASLARDLGVTSSAIYKDLDKIKSGLKDYLEKNGVHI